jgi:hypothetical protein
MKLVFKKQVFLLGNNRHVSDIVLIIHNFPDLFNCKVYHCILV